MNFRSSVLSNVFPSLRNNFITIERVRFTLISKKTPLSKHSFRFDTVATTGHYRIVREGFAAPELKAIRHCSYVVVWIRVIDGIC